VKKDIAQITQKIKKSKQFYIALDKDVKKNIQFSNKLDFDKKMQEINEVYEIQLLKEYQRFSKRVLAQIDTHKKEEKQYRIQNTEMFERIMRLLDEEQKLGKPEALTVLGFLYF